MQSSAAGPPPRTPRGLAVQEKIKRVDLSVLWPESATRPRAAFSARVRCSCWLAGGRYKGGLDYDRARDFILDKFESQNSAGKAKL